MSGMTVGIVGQWIAFVVFALIAIAGALGMATTMSMFRSGIFLMASFMGVAGLFILLLADLLGFLQIMMYIGGMLVMILFMVLFAHDPGGDMMAGMKMSPIEDFFSLGLLPRKEGQGGNGEQEIASPQTMAAGNDVEGQASERENEERGDGEQASDMGGMDMSGMSMTTPGPATLPVDGTHALPPPTLSRTGSAKTWVRKALPCSYSPSAPTTQALP